MKQITVLHKITYPFININVLHLQRNWRVASHDWCGCSASGISLAVCDQCGCSATRIYRWVRVEMFLWRHGLVRLLCQWNLFVGVLFWSYISSRLISHVNNRYKSWIEDIWNKSIKFSILNRLQTLLNSALSSPEP